MTTEFEIQLTDLDTGRVNRLTHWSDYTYISDLMSPAGTFTATIAPTASQRAFTAPGGQLAKVFAYGALQETAITDERSEATNKTSTDLQVSGRGVGGLLIDSVIPPSVGYSIGNLTLEQIVNRITDPWQPDYITSVVTSNEASRFIAAGAQSNYTTKSKYKIETLKDGNGNAVIGPDGKPIKVKKLIPGKTVNTNLKKFGKSSPYYRGTNQETQRRTRIKPGEKVWSVIARLCKMIAAHPFVGCDGALVIGRPTYDFDASAYGDGLVLDWNESEQRATGGNVLRQQFETSIAERHSETIVWGSGKPRKTSMGAELKRHTWSVKDPAPAFWVRSATSPFLTTNKLYKPNLITVKNVANEDLIRRIARGMVEEAIIGAFSLEYEIAGHHINDVLPVVDSMIPVRDQRLGIEDNYYIVRVERKYTLTEGKTTVLKLIPPEIWLYFDHDATGDDEYLEHMVQRVWW
jgi:prophage tail gpP-like protein